MPRILVVRVGAIGDTLMVTPLIRALKAADSQARIDFLCSELAAPLLELNEALSGLFTLRWRNLPYLVSWEKRSLVRRLRRLEYQKAVLLEAAPRYRELLEMARIQDIRSFRETPFDPELHSVVNNLRAAGVAVSEEHIHDMDVPLSEVDHEEARSLLDGLPRPIIGLHAGYGPLTRKGHQSTRLRGWSNANFAELARLLVEAGSSLVLTGSGEDCADAEEIMRGLPNGKARMLAGRTSLRCLAALIGAVDLYVSVDSGPAHIAAAVSTPLMVLWGPGRLEQTRPLSSRSPIKIIRHPVPCAPCYGTPEMKTCQENICMLGISPRAVFDEARAFLSSIATSGTTFADPGASLISV